MEFRWDNNDGYKKLYYYQTSAIQDDRADWYLTLREKDRKTAMLKLTVTVPDFFDAKLKPERMSLCRTSRGSMMSRSKCLEEVPATIEVNEDQTAIEVFPTSPCPWRGTTRSASSCSTPKGSGCINSTL
jgi:lipopolysaccharide export LptBFGC system permease protein LptF